MARSMRSIGAFLVLLALLVGVPLTLGSLIGNPLAGWSDLKAGDLSDTAVIDILAAIAWIAWAQFALATVIEALALLARVRVPRRIPGVFAGQQHLARALIAAIFVLTPTVVGIVAPATSFASAPAPAVAAVAQAHVQAEAPQARPQAEVSTPRAEVGTPHAERIAATHEYLVPASGGPATYWELAERYLGAGDQWKQIWQLNEGRQQADGATMLSPGLLRPGWVVLIPGEAPAHTHTVIEHVTVRPGDTLSGIAEKAGQPDWQQAWQVNADRAEPGGREFSDPDLILPGWTVDVPVAVANPVVATTPAVPAPTAIDPVSTPIAHTPTVHSAPAVTSVTAESVALREVLEGGGALLAAGLLAALGMRRRRQFRHRRPGRAVAAAPLSLLDVERAVLDTGPAGEADVAFLDRALRSLAQQVEQPGQAGLPDLAAVRIVADQVDLRLSEPHPVAPPPPWVCDETGFWWSVNLTDDLPLDESAGRGLAPYPTLVTVGTGEAGDRWLLDLERAGAVSVVGGVEPSTDLARFAAAELALNGWSDHLNVIMVGFGAELVGLNPQRLSHTADISRAIDLLTSAMASAGQARQVSGEGVLQSRLANGRISASPQVIFIDPAAVHDDEALQRLLWTVRTQPDRSAVSVVLLADREHTHQTRYQLELTAAGRLQLGALGLDLRAQQLSREQAGAFAELVASLTDVTDRRTPAPVHERTWTPWVDEAGLLRPEFLQPAETAPGGPAGGVAGIRLSAVGPLAEPAPDASSLLPEDDARYLEQAATTAEDIARLAPNVPPQLSTRIDDPELDADLAEWSAPEPTRPRLSVLGPVLVQAAGNAGAVAGRVDFYSELVARLALSADPQDLLAGAGAADLVRAMAMLSSWLGADPVTGQAYLRQDEPAATDILTDVDLFRRLRLRGQARGGKGMSDLVRALRLVRGEPFAQRRIGGYAWLVDSQLDHIYRGMIIDVAHLVATRALAERDPETARWAAEIGLGAGGQDDVPLLDLVAVCTAQGLLDEREQYVRTILGKHDVEVEEDLPARTAQILRRRGWDAAAS